MAVERDIHAILVLEIEKHPALYNNNLPEYSRKNVTEKIWSEISHKTHLSVNDCKEKWRNIRSNYLRSLKSSSKQKKPYYLTEYMSFILPFVKANSEYKSYDNIHVDHSDPEGEEQQSIVVEVEPATATSSNNSQYNEDSILEEPATTIGNFHTTRRRRCNEDSTTNQREMNHFFLSLLSEFDDMTVNQIRSFKIKVLQLIDDIKQGNQSSSQTVMRQNCSLKSDSDLQESDHK